MSERKGGHFKTFTGRQVWPLDLRPEDIDPIDIAHHLALECRFGGATHFHYSVAQHSFLVARILTPKEPTIISIHGLFHDAAEAYLKDVIRPLKRCPEFAAYRAAEKAAMDAIADRFGLERGFHKRHEIKHADNLMLAAEKRDLTAPCDWDLEVLPDPKDIPWVEVWSWEYAKLMWLEEYEYAVRKGLVKP